MEIRTGTKGIFLTPMHAGGHIACGMISERRGSSRSQERWLRRPASKIGARGQSPCLQEALIQHYSPVVNTSKQI